MNYLQELRKIYSPDESRAIYRLVMEECFGLNQTDTLLGKDKELSQDDKQKEEKIFIRLLSGEPVQYVLGYSVFCSHTFYVQSDVLIPRPETEDLVERVCSSLPSSSSVLVIGTGSGCIAVSLALRGYCATATDISVKALDVARENAAHLGADIRFLRAAILHPCPSLERWDAIVSNPPYICHSEASQMHSNVLCHEPHIALFVPDDDPLLFYRAIAEYGTQHLCHGGNLFFEINRAYDCQTIELLGNEGYTDVQVFKDRFGNNRIIQASYEGNQL